MKHNDIVIICDGAETAASTVGGEIIAVGRLAQRMVQPGIIDRIVVSVNEHMNVAQSAAKIFLSIEREMRHPKEQTNPRSPKQRFRKGR